MGLVASRSSSLTEMDLDKILEDSVPCRVRAKRGCATHPRSIAERVRNLFLCRQKMCFEFGFK